MGLREGEKPLQCGMTVQRLPRTLGLAHMKPGGSCLRWL